MPYKTIELVVTFLTIASVIVAVPLYTIPLSQDQISVIYIFDFIVVVILAANFYSRVKESEQGLKYIRKNWYEIPAMVPLFVFGAIEAQPIIGASLRALMLIRIFKLLHLIRLVNLFRSLKYLTTSGFIYFLVFIAVAVIFGSVGMYVAERESKFYN